MNRRSAAPWTVKGKLCLVTGATSGIGAATAAGLARRGARVLLVARTNERGQAAAAGIRATVPGAQLEVLPCDLARMADVRLLARTVADVYGHLDVLINNAGVVNFTRRTTSDGYEHTLAVNHLAPFLLTSLLRDAMSIPVEARVLTVTSDNHRTVRSVPFDDIHCRHHYKPLEVYNRTKLMNIWFTHVVAMELAGTQITANCLSPGFVRTNLARDAKGGFAVFIRLVAPFQISPETGAQTSVHLASSPELSGNTGGYYRKSALSEPHGLAKDLDSARRLWRLSAELTGVATTIE